MLETIDELEVNRIAQKCFFILLFIFGCRNSSANVVQTSRSESESQGEMLSLANLIDSGQKSIINLIALKSMIRSPGLGATLLGAVEHSVALETGNVPQQ